MKRLRGLFLIAVALSISVLSYAGDVVYTMWEDDQSQFWVRIQNDTDRAITVESILIVYYNNKGKPVDQKKVPCKGKCRLSARDTRDFGPYDPPPGTDSARVRNVNYTVE